MARRPATDPTLGLDRIRKEQGKTRRARLRIMIASDPHRPIRTISLPRALPVIVSALGGTLLLATIVFAFRSWKMSDGVTVLERRVHAMVQAADSVALRHGDGNADVDVEGGAPSGGRRVTLTHALATPARAPGGDIGRFVVQSANTGEEMEVSLNLNTGEVEAGAYRQLRHLMRCLRTGAETPTDPRLIDLLYRISQRTRQKIILVSGFRAPMFSIAALSYHTRGMAADIRIPGMTPLMVRDLAASMGVRGIGYYPVSGFVHVDVRDEHVTWTDYGKNRQDGENAEHAPEHGQAAEQGEEAGEAAL